MNSPPGPTPDWFGRPEPAPSGRSGSILIAVVITFVLTVVACATVGFAFYIALERDRQVTKALHAAERAQADENAAMERMRAQLACETEIARAKERCAAARLRVGDPPGDPDTSPSAKDILSVIQASRGRFRACFNDLLRTTPDAQGKAALRLVVSPEGRVTDAKATESTLPASMNECLEATARALRFPASGEQQTVNVPLSFVAQ